MKSLRLHDAGHHATSHAEKKFPFSTFVNQTGEVMPRPKAAPDKALRRFHVKDDVKGLLKNQTPEIKRWPEAVGGTGHPRGG
jgi:hypothetical protein